MFPEELKESLAEGIGFGVRCVVLGENVCRHQLLDVVVGVRVFHADFTCGFLDSGFSGVVLQQMIDDPARLLHLEMHEEFLMLQERNIREECALAFEVLLVDEIELAQDMEVVVQDLAPDAEYRLEQVEEDARILHDDIVDLPATFVFQGDKFDD